MAQRRSQPGVFRGRCRADQRLLVEAFFWLALARIVTLAFPFRWTTSLLSLKPGDGMAPHPTVRNGDALSFAKRAGWALTFLGGRTPWESRCLTKALAGAGML